MARPKEFDESRAVAAAMRVFWSHGYEATSTQDLCAATSLGRSSIYHTFHSKHELFSRALAHYIEVCNTEFERLLTAEGPIRDRLWSVMEHAVNEDTTGDRNGCMVVNTTIELGPHDPDVDAMLRGNYESRISLLRTVLEAARRSGELDPGTDVTSLADFVHTTIGGMRLAARAGADRPTLLGIARTALSAV